jgi:transcriptional regulator with XRE-family HTH domain
MEVYVMNIGLRIKEYRIIRRLSQNDLGQLIGVSKQAVSMYERGERLPDASTLVSLSKALNVDVDTLLGNISNGEQKRNPAEEHSLSDGEKAMIDLFRSASPYQQEMILRMLEAAVIPKE